MMQIRPVSDLRNKFTDIEKVVQSGDPVYLTKNGYGAYTIMSIEEAEELDRIKAACAVVSDLRRAEARADREGWLDDDDMRKVMGI